MSKLLLLLLLFIQVAQAEVKEEARPYGRLLMRPQILPMNFTWQELGLSKESSFTRPVAHAWEKWLSENLPGTVSSVAVCEGTCVAFAEEWESKPQREVLSNGAQDFADAVWLTLELQLWREQDGQGLPRFSWQGRVVLLDVNTKRVLGSYTLGREERRFPELAEQKLNSALGSQIYRAPLPQLQAALKSLEAPKLSRFASVNVTGHRHVLDALELMKLLQTRGSQLALVPSLESFGGGEARFLCFYRGEEKSFTDLLSRLNEVKSSHSYSLTTEVLGDEYLVKMVAE